MGQTALEPTKGMGAIRGSCGTRRFVPLSRAVSLVPHCARQQQAVAAIAAAAAEEGAATTRQGM